MIEKSHSRFLIYGTCAVLVFGFFGAHPLRSAETYTAPPPDPVPPPISGDSSATIAIPGWFGDLVFDTKDNKWLVVSQANPGNIVGRFLGSDSTPISNVFNISPASSTGKVYAPSVAYSPDANKFLVVWSNALGGSGNLSAPYGIFVNPDGTTGNAFRINVDGTMNIGSQKTSVLKYDSKNKKFVLIWMVPGGGPRLTTITSSGGIGPIVDLFTGTGGGNWSPKIAVNEDKDEYCAVYDQRNSGKWAVRQINAANLSPGTESVVSITTVSTDIAYNSLSKKYLVIYNDASGGTSGRFLNSCNATDSDSGDFSILEGVRSARVSANPTSDTFGVIGQNQSDYGSNYVVLDSDGQILSQETLLVPSVNGQYVQMIAANSNDGSYAVITDRDYAETVMLTGVGAGLVAVPPVQPFPASVTLPVPSQGLPTDLGQLISAIFVWSLSLIGLVIFVRFFYAGFLWFTAAGSSDRTSRAKTIMKNAVYGTLVLFSAYLILNTINPDLVKSTFTLPGLPASQGPVSVEGEPPPQAPSSCNQKFSVASSTGCSSVGSCVDVSSYTSTHGCESNGGICLLSSQASNRARALIASFNTLATGKSCALKISSAIQTNGGPSVSQCHKPGNTKSGTCADFNIIGNHDTCAPYFYQAAKDTGAVVSFLDEYPPCPPPPSATGGNIHVNF